MCCLFLLTNSTAFGCEGLRHLTVCRGVSYHSCFHTFKSIFLELAMIVALLNGKIHLLLPQKYCSFMFFLLLLPEEVAFPSQTQAKITEFVAVTTTTTKKQWQWPRERGRKKELTSWQSLGFWGESLDWYNIQHAAWSGAFGWALSYVVLVSLAVAGWEVSHWSEDISWYFGSKPSWSCRATTVCG